MKFMKLGSKLGILTERGNSTSVGSELPSDITFDVDGHKFHLHKFPLLAKCGCLNKLIASALESGSEEVLINEFPGRAKCFEMCAKYCYGISITLSPHIVGEMTEVTEKSNMIYKLEVFLNSSILRGWKDTIICLRRSTAYLPWCEDLKTMGRCIESISSRACVNPAESSPGSWRSRRMTSAPNDWWVEDLSDLDIHLYGRVLFFEQVRPTVNGSLPDDNSGSIHDPKYGEEINLPKVNNDNSRKSSSEQALGKAP
uniref:BTB domain-containing protein n=1 Tax=Physcomitrium patens TaxID=3218 RepID=A0A2K1KMI6_PHYPA|nr:hypothetical protein PHYPA_005885 [Physcomitrium patens]